jgi:transcriptional regulator with XRE-family HTH domain
MSEVAHSIDLDLAAKLQGDSAFRREFFHAEASAKIAEQLIRLRKRRDLTQGELAKLAGTGQPAISRCERADYQNWTINTLRSITEALDGRLTVIIEAAEDVIGEYKKPAPLEEYTPPKWALASFAEAQEARRIKEEAEIPPQRRRDQMEDPRLKPIGSNDDFSQRAT